MIEDNKKYDSKRQKVSLRNLYLDPNNYRLINEPEYVEVPEDKIKDKMKGSINLKGKTSGSE